MLNEGDFLTPGLPVSPAVRGGVNHHWDRPVVLRLVDMKWRVVWEQALSLLWVPQRSGWGRVWLDRQRGVLWFQELGVLDGHHPLFPFLAHQRKCGQVCRRSMERPQLKEAG